MTESVAQRLTDGAVDATRAAVRDAGGNEVFLLGVLDAAGRVATVRVLARGNRQAVAALLQVPRPGEVVLHNHPSGVLTPSDADLAVASALGNSGVGTYVVDNAVTRVYAVVEPLVPRAAARLATTDALEWLGPASAVAQRLHGYEHRPEQLRMLAAVTAAFDDDGVLSVEAGTGTGKSLAYLLPAIRWSQLNRERVLVSTHTINLQEQLVAKDLPFLVNQVGLECTVALVKGRGNYLCQRKAAQADAQGSLLVDDEQHRELRDLLAWARQTSDGSLSDLPARPRAEVWEQLVSENDNCLRTRCPYYATCFFYAARRAAASADLVVVNHHLLMADLALRAELGSYTQNGILPPARRVIVDEAHHLADVATSYFGLRLGYTTLERPLARLRSLKHAHRGVLPALVIALESLEAPDERPLAEGAVRWIEERVLPQRLSLLADAEQCFAELADELETFLGRAVEPGVEEKVRIVPEIGDSPLWRRVEDDLTRLADACGRFAEDLDGVCRRVDVLAETAGKQVLYLATELHALQGRVRAFAEGLLAFVGEDEGVCRWLEARRRPRGDVALTCNTAPVTVGTRLREALFEQFPTVVLTSATLAVDRRFDYLHRELGLDALSIPERVQTLQVDSPFDFANQALLAIPDDVPDPNAAGYEAATHTVIADAVRAAGGATFVLFTAYGALNRAVAALEAGLTAEGFCVLRQGEMNRHLLLQRFVQGARAVLFATDSFWEGVDVRGDALRCVIIARLPFRVPTEPIEQARVEAIESRGGNAFHEHTVPQAVIKLKQGFGRLIRSRTDRGAVLLLDSRVVTKAYGRVFLESLPPARRVVADGSTVAAALRRFFAEGSAG